MSQSTVQGKAGIAGLHGRRQCCVNSGWGSEVTMQLGAWTRWVLSNTPLGVGEKKNKTTNTWVKFSVAPTRPTGYPPKGVTNGMWADRVVAVGSQDVIAAKCCPGRSLAAREEKEKDKLGEREYSAYLRIQSNFKYQVQTVYKCHISEKQTQVVPF